MTGWNSWDEMTQELPRLPPAFFDDPVFRAGGPPPVKDVGPAVETEPSAPPDAGRRPGLPQRWPGRRPNGAPARQPRPPAPPGGWPGAADETVVIPPGSLDETVVLPPIPPIGPRPGPPPPRGGRSGPSQSLGRASRTMAIASAASRLTGFLRSLAVTAAIGVALVGNAYNTANTLPNIVYELLLGGVLTSVVVPLLVQAQERDRDRGVAYAQRLLSLAVAGLGRRDPAGHAGRAAADVALLVGVGAKSELTTLFALPAAAADLLLRPRRDDRRGPQHQGRVRAAGLGAGAQQRGRDRRRRPCSSC